MPSVRNAKSSVVNVLPPEEFFQEIMRLYDIAENMVAAIEGDDIVNRNVQLELAKPLVAQITNSANIISAFYTDVERNGRQLTTDVKDTIEGAFRNIVFAYREFLDGVEDKLLSHKKSL